MRTFDPDFPHTALVLTGGGARGAYQAGVMKAVSKIAFKEGITHPFSIISGTSAGAVNAASLASYADNFLLASKLLCDSWSKLTTKQIIRTDLFAFSKIASSWIWKLLSGGVLGGNKLQALLDSSPLRRFLEETIPFDRIEKNLREKHLYSLAITAVDYTDGSSHVFFQGEGSSMPWKRMRRSGEETCITKEHVMASSAIPILFPPIEVNGRWYGDGSVRNYSPLSPMIRMGATKIMIVPSRSKDKKWVSSYREKPSLGKIMSILLNSILMDGVDFDYDRLMRLNRLCKHVPQDVPLPTKSIEMCVIRPSEDLGEIALSEIKSMPRALRYFMSGLGPADQADDLLGTLLFEKGYITKLLDLGYRDAMRQEGEIMSFFLK